MPIFPTVFRPPKKYSTGFFGVYDFSSPIKLEKVVNFLFTTTLSKKTLVGKLFSVASFRDVVEVKIIENRPGVWGRAIFFYRNVDD